MKLLQSRAALVFLVAMGGAAGAQSQVPQIARLTDRATALLETLKDKERLKEACNITTAHFAAAVESGAGLDPSDPRFPMIVNVQQCCTTTVALGGAQVGTGFLGMVNPVGGAGVGGGIAFTVKLINAFVKGELNRCRPR